MSATGIGAAVRRKEDHRFITGQGRYTDDVNRPGQAHAYFLRSPHAHAKIKSVDTKAAAGMPGVIVPRRTVDLLKDFAGDKDKVQVALSVSRIRFAIAGEDGAERVSMTSKLIDGTFPDYTRVVPERHANSFVLAREALAKAIDRVVTISAGAKGSAVKFGFAPDALKLSAHNADVGDAEDEVKVDKGEGEPVEIGFNGRYCLDMLAATSVERATFYIGDAGDPARVEPEDDGAATFVIMPMRV